MNRAVDKLTDDEIVDAVASFGVHGPDPDDLWEASMFDLLKERLDVVFFDDGSHEIDTVDTDLVERIKALPERLCLREDDVYMLTLQEWARRLVGKPVDEIERMLKGVGS